MEPLGSPAPRSFSFYTPGFHPSLFVLSGLIFVPEHQNLIRNMSVLMSNLNSAQIQSLLCFMEKGLICCAIYPGARAAFFTFNCFPLLSASSPQRAESKALYSCTNKASLSSRLLTSNTWCDFLCQTPSLSPFHTLSLSSLFDVSDLRILSLTVLLALTGAHICARTFPDSVTQHQQFG